MVTVLLSLFVALCTVQAQVCEFISDKSDPCSFVIENCQGEKFLINYLELYYCSTSYKAIFFILIGFWLLTLFYLMYNIAENHFSLSLMSLSEILGLSPDIAGLTLLAFGNGAPDFFTALAGTEDNPALILSFSIGGGLFITTVVLGLVILFSKEIILPSVDNDIEVIDNSYKLPRVSFMRNTFVYLISTLVLLGICFFGRIHFMIPLMMVIFFCLYIIVNLVVYVLSKKSKVSELLNEPISKVTSHASFRSNRFSFIKDVCGFSQRNCLESFIFILTLPLDFIVSLTVPPMDELKYYPEHTDTVFRKIQRLRIVFNPFFSILFACFALELYSVKIGIFPLWILFVFVGVLLSIVVWFTTSLEHKPQYFPAYIFYGFSACILWIYVTSSELVSALTALAKICGISNTVLGVTLLAWGNSFGDLVADIAISKNGGFSTAVSAVFSGPVQNILLALGLCFCFAAIKSGGVFEFADLPSDVYLGLIFLIGSLCLTILSTCFVFKYRIPRWYGYCLLGLYLVYVPIAVLVGIEAIKF